MLRALIYIPFVNILVWLVNVLPGHSLALAIIVFTIVLRFILLIPNKRALESQKKIQALQPEIDRLRDQYKDDQAEQGKALMDLYKKNEISPLGSCLPLLIQLPIFIVLYRILLEGFSDSALSVLYPFVARPEIINTTLFGINLSLPDTTYILPILAAGLQFIQTMATMMSGRKKGQQIPGQTMFYIFPLMTFFIARSVNAGAALYWVVTTIFGIVQQVIVNRSKTPLIHTSQLDLPKPHHHNQTTATETPSKNSATQPASTETKKGKGNVTVTIRRPGK